MRVLQIITRMDSIGGAQRHLVELCQKAAENGHEMHLAHGGRMALDAEDLRGIHLHPVDNLVRPIAPWKDLNALIAIRKLIKKLQPDLVATHSTKAGIIGRYAAWMTATPDVHTVHGWSLCFSGSPLKKLLYSQIEGKTHRLADGVICVSEFDKSHAIHLGLKSSRLRLIYNGRPTPAEKEIVAPLSSTTRVISVGRLAWPKQPAQLLRFLVKNSSVQLDLVGDGPDEQSTKELAEKLGVADRVVFHGHVDNIYPLLKQADIFALVSDWEGFPMSTLEAMSVGLPTIVSDVGGAGEAIDDGVTGYAIPRGDETNLHKRLAELLDDPAKREVMGRKASELFDQKFQLGSMVDQTLTLYNEVLAR
ncbi:MAG: glycosyltransferase family 4 protein [Akkermansiaceae bacterium]